MVKLPSLSLFSRLYLTIAVAMIVSGTIAAIVIENVHKQGVIDDYVSFSDNIYADLIKEKKIVLNGTLHKLNDDIHKVEGYLISWQIRFNSKPPCDDCEWYGSSGKVDIFINNLEQFYAVYKLPDVEAWLVIFENQFFTFNNDEEKDEENDKKGIFSDYSFHDIEEITMLLVVFITVAGSIYWPVRVIKRQIENLITVQHQFGAGDLQVRANDSFTKPLDELASSFNDMARAISETVNENQVFAQAVPHEVRTPLSRVQLAVGLLRQNNHDQKQLALLENIDTYIGDVSVLIDQVVSFSKLNSVKDENEVSLYRTIQLSEFIESRIEATKCGEKITVIRQMDNSLTLTNNPAYLRLLVDNLLKNASIHGKKQLVVTLHTVNGHIELSVEDDGDGIPNECLDTIFIPFSRVDVSRSRKTGGLGLGLAISKAACKRMNCDIRVENKPTTGAKFTCRFT